MQVGGTPSACTRCQARLDKSIDADAQRRAFASRALKLNVATHTFVHFEHPEAFELARITSIQYDLTSTLDLCNYLEAQVAASPNGWPVSEVTDAFSTAIVIRYNRAFVTGARHGLRKEDLAILTDGQREAHERFRALRDKHFAHSVNAFEDTRVQARYCLERVDEEGITSVSAAHYRVFGLSQDDLVTIKALCECFLSHLKQIEKNEQKRLLSVIRAVPLAEVLSAKSAPLMVPAKVRVEKRRPRP